MKQQLTLLGTTCPLAVSVSLETVLPNPQNSDPDVVSAELNAKKSRH